MGDSEGFLRKDKKKDFPIMCGKCFAVKNPINPWLYLFIVNFVAQQVLRELKRLYTV